VDSFEVCRWFHHQLSRRNKALYTAHTWRTLIARGAQISKERDAENRKDEEHEEEHHEERR
jgi:hypothetical protein